MSRIIPGRIILSRSDDHPWLTIDMGKSVPVNIGLKSHNQIVFVICCPRSSSAIEAGVDAALLLQRIAIFHGVSMAALVSLSSGLAAVVAVAAVCKDLQNLQSSMSLAFQCYFCAAEETFLPEPAISLCLYLYYLEKENLFQCRV